MKQESPKGKTQNNQEPGSAKNRQAIDKTPGEERGKAEKLTEKDLKGKKVDADPSKEEGRPIS
jgi:hypothetical protein